MRLAGRGPVGAARRRYQLAVSAGYVVIGTIIAVRSVLGHVLPLILLGVVFIALGAVRIRDYVRWKQAVHDS